LDQLDLAARYKQQFTPQDSVFFQVSYFDSHSGDLAQYFDQSMASQTLRVTERQEPNLLAGYHREWAPGSHTLFLGGRFEDTLLLKDPAPALLFLRTFLSPFTGTTNVSVVNPAFFSLNYRSELEAYSGELQQIWQTPYQTLVLGGRYQAGWSDTESVLNRQTPVDVTPSTISAQRIDTELDRFSVYAYEQWQIFEPLRLTAGLSYDRLHYPRDIDTSPITSAEATKDQVSPKVGLLFTPWEDTHLRAFYTRSLGGVFFDTSVRLEPTQIAGFNQALRSLIPESVVGLVPGTRFETWGVGLNQAVKKTRTYLFVDGEILESDATRTVGILTNSDMAVPVADSSSSTRQSLDYEEKSLVVTLNQLLGKEYSVGARYRLTHADLDGRFTDISSSAASAVNQDVSATLNELYLYGLYNHRSGIFAQFNAVWAQQSNHDYAPPRPGDDFWQYHLYLGYRFLRRHAEARLGLLNITDRDYRLNPLTLYNELPRERMMTASFKFYF
jgi:outer membrane receptor protein involved in Fe transport